MQARVEAMISRRPKALALDDSPAFLNSLAYQLSALIKGKPHHDGCACAACLYFRLLESSGKERGRRPDKVAFFIHYIWAQIQGAWTYGNVSGLKKTEVPVSSGWEKVRKVMDNLVAKDEKFENFFLRGFETEPRTVRRQVKRHRIEPALLSMLKDTVAERLEVGFRNLPPESEVRKAFDHAKLASEQLAQLFKRISEDEINTKILCDYIQAAGTTTLNWMRRHSRKIQRITPADLEQALWQLELSGRIVIRKHGGRTFLIWVGQSHV